MDDPFVPRAENRLEKYNSARAIFYPSFFFIYFAHCEFLVGNFFSKRTFTASRIFTNSFQHFSGLDLIEKTLKMTETLPDSTLRNLLW